MAASYKPTADEIEAFNRDLTKYSPSWPTRVATSPQTTCGCSRNTTGRAGTCGSSRTSLASPGSNQTRIVSPNRHSPQRRRPPRCRARLSRPPQPPQGHPNAAVQAARDAFVGTYAAVKVSR